MSFERVSFKGDVFPRRGESEDEWLSKSHNDETPIATCNMEITGETSPMALSDTSQFCKLSLQNPYVYHYTWTLGLTGRIGFDWLDRLDEDDTVLVQLIIHNGNSRYISREIFGTLEYLPPTKTLREEPSFLAWCKKIILSSANVVEFTGGQIAGALTTTIGNIIPNDKNETTKWYLNKFDITSDSNHNEHSYGVEWHISRSVIKEVGSRLVGRLGVVYLDAPLQNKKLNTIDLESGVNIQRKAGLKLKGDHGHWYDFSVLPLCNSDELILKVKPQSYTESKQEEASSYADQFSN